MFVGVIVILIFFTISVRDTNDVESSIQNTFVKSESTFIVGESSSDYELAFSGILEASKRTVVPAESSGLIRTMYVGEGDSVVTGELLAVVDYATVDALLESGEAVLNSKQVTLDSIVINSDSNIQSAESSLLALDTTLKSLLADTEQSIDTAYNIALESARSILNNSLVSLIVLTDIQEEEPGSYLYDETVLVYYKGKVVEVLLGTPDAGRFNAVSLSKLSGGLKEHMLTQTILTTNEIDVVLSLLNKSLVDLNNAFGVIAPGVYIEYSVGTPTRSLFDNTVVSLRADLEKLVTLQSSITTALVSQKTSIANINAEKEVLLTTIATLKNIRVSNENVALSGVSVAEQSLNELSVQKNKAFIRAPYAGVVGAKFVTEGEMVQVGSPVFSILDTHTWKVKVLVPDRYNTSLKKGLKVQVSIDGVPGEYFGIISKIIPEVDSQSRKIPVEVEIMNLPDVARDGLFARVSLTVSEEAVAYYIPREYVVYGYDGLYLRGLYNETYPIVIKREDESGVYVTSEQILEGVTLSR